MDQPIPCLVVRHGGLPQALAILRDMAAEGPDVISYNGVISCFEKASNWLMALEMLAEMLRVKIRQSVISFSAAISACEKGPLGREILLKLSRVETSQLFSVCNFSVIRASRANLLDHNHRPFLYIFWGNQHVHLLHGRGNSRIAAWSASSTNLLMSPHQRQLRTNHFWMGFSMCSRSKVSNGWSF